MQTYLDLGGTYRARTAQETLSKVQPLLKKFGITRLANITGLDDIGIPVYLAIRPNSKHISVSLGKGPTVELAKVSAMMESIEQWYAENIPQEHLIVDSYQNLLSQKNIVDPTTIAYGIYQTDVLTHWPLRWCCAQELNSKQDILIPFDAISLDSTQLNKAALLFQTSSNGLASGNSLDEAICHAIYEIIERDAYFRFSILTPEKKKSRLLNNDSIDSKIALDILQKFQQASLAVTIFDLTSELGIPAFQCIISDQSIARKTQVFSGKGCHIEKEIALVRALTEAAQTRLTFISGSRDDVFPSYYKKLLLSPKQNLLGEADYTKIIQLQYEKSFSANIDMLLKLLSDKGFPQVILFQHTEQESEVHVARILIPHLMVAPEL